MKTIAEIARDHLLETNNPGVGWGDDWLIDEIAGKCDSEIGTDLFSDTFPAARHQRILNALSNTKKGKKLFKQKYIRIYRNRSGRFFELKEKLKLKEGLIKRKV